MFIDCFSLLLYNKNILYVFSGPKGRGKRHTKTCVSGFLIYYDVAKGLGCRLEEAISSKENFKHSGMD